MFTRISVTNGATVVQFFQINYSHLALGYGLDDQWFESRQGLGNFLFTTASRPALRPTQPPIQWVLDALSLGVKRPRRETGHSFPPSAEVKNAWSYTSIHPYVFMAQCLVKYAILSEVYRGGGLSSGVKREADHSPPSFTEVKKCLELYLHSPIPLHGVVLS
jgi:hypothetical protein